MESNAPLTVFVSLMLATSAGCQSGDDSSPLVPSERSCQNRNYGLVAESSFPIVGGDVPGSAHPVASYTVAVHSSKVSCSGTLIARDLVLTAAHCIDPSGMKVQLGTSPDCGGHPIIIGAMMGRAHNYKRAARENQNDIGLVRLSLSVPAPYAPVALATDAIAATVGTGSTIIVAGYGQTRVGQPNPATIDGFLRFTESPMQDYRYSETEFQISQTDGRGSCYGDSGGPAFVVSGGRYLVIGVASRGDELCAYDGIYTKVPSYVGWLRDTARALGSALPR